MQNPEALIEAEKFVNKYGNLVLTQLGYIGQTEIYFGNGWATNLETHAVFVDINAFGDETYKPQWKVLAFAHELEAHHAPAKREPTANDWAIRWGREHPAGPIFLNILSDMAGNRSIITKVPNSKEDWHDFYESKLFPETDYTYLTDEQGKSHQLPRHIQFLYAMIRETFVPDEQCIVDEEVREVLDSLHDYKGSGQDLISYSTQPFKTQSQYLTRNEQMILWRKGIWPEYLKLYEKDLEDRQQQNQQGEGDPDESNQGSGQGSENTDQNQEGKSKPFNKEYQDYEENRHPGDTHNHSKDKDKDKKDDNQGGEGDGDDHKDEQDAIDKILSNNPNTEPSKSSNESKRNPFKRDPNHERNRAREIKKEKAEKANITLEEYEEIESTIAKVLPYIQEMRTVFQQFINERLAYKKALTHQQTEGPLLDPDNLAHTMARINAGKTEELPAFLDYTIQEKERSMVGKIDFWIVVDSSPSMYEYGAKKAKLANTAIVTALEGLDMFNEMVAEQSRQHGFKLDYDARSGVISFDDSFKVNKPLGLSLTLKDRVDATRNIRSNYGGTNAGPALEYIKNNYLTEPAADRKKIIVFLTDGEDQYPDSVAREISQLRQLGVNVFPIYIQSEVVDSRGVRIDNISELPEELSRKVQESLI